MDRQKALYIGLASLGTVLLVVIVFSVISALGGKRYTSGKEAPYPYAWTEKRDGSVSLALDARNAPGGEWYEDAPEGGVADVSRGRTRSGVTAYFLRPVTAGRTELTFTLRQDGERLADVVFTVEARRRTGEQKHDAMITSHVERVYQQYLTGGEDTGFPYAADSYQDGELWIHIRDPLLASGIPGTVFSDAAADAPTLENWASNWTVSVTRTEEQASIDTTGRWTASASDRSVLYPDGPVPGAEGPDFWVRCVKDGTAKITISCEAEDISYVFTVRSMGGTASITKAASGRYQPSKQEADAEADAAIASLLSGLPTDALEAGAKSVQEAAYEEEPELTPEQERELSDLEKQELEELANWTMPDLPDREAATETGP